MNDVSSDGTKNCAPVWLRIYGLVINQNSTLWNDMSLLCFVL
jgi:hypothetical protein